MSAFVRRRGAARPCPFAPAFHSFANFDIGGEVDIRMLVADDVLELHLRGGFFTLSSIPYVNISGGLGVAF